ncbi:MAG: 1,4-dihydroxy-2-naphthoate polyprenyltransferase [Acidimicrobiales bacterium]
MTTSWRLWVAGARPRTFPAAIVPVAVGTAVGYASSGRLVITSPARAGHGRPAGYLMHDVNWTNALCALVVALFIQIGTNYVNDYADGVRGTDEVRVGPVRLVAGGLASVRAVKIAALVSFGVAALAGLYLAAHVSWWLIVVGLVCGLAGWAYTGGPHPYGYLGLGEVFVFIFFGLVATAGSAYVQHAPFSLVHGSLVYTYHFDWAYPLWTGAAVGLLAVALLEANNMRDIETDAVAGKRTVAVRLGRRRAGFLYVALLLGTALAIGVLHRWNAWSLLALAALPLSLYPVRIALSERTGRKLLPLLGATARLQIGVGLLLTLGIVIGSS